jgi:hypothetical protein
MAVNYAEAQSINGVCKMRFSDDPSANAALKALMAKYQDVASVACIDPGGKVISYTSVTKVREGPQHVCVFRQITDLYYPDLKSGRAT